MPVSPALRVTLAAFLSFAALASAAMAAPRVAPATRSGEPVRTRLDRRLAREATQEREAEVAPDDDPTDPRYQPRPLPDRAGVRAPRPFGATNYGPNVRLSTSVAPPNVGESEVTLAAIGDKLVAGWNDGLVFGEQPGFVGYAYSTNGGATWMDGGSLPVADVADVYYGDPVLVADPADHWYFADLYRLTPGETGISVNHGTFAGASPAWDLPNVIATSFTDLLDKPWLAVDPMDGTVYVAYVRFHSTGQHIEFSRSLDHGTTWSAPVVLTNSVTTSVMSPRLVVGPDHELYLLYYSAHHADNLEYLELRSSANHGQTWGPPRTVAGRPYSNNFYSGPAGYNRERVVALVSADVDRTAGPSRGRLHVVWHEMEDVYADPIGTGPTTPELEPNDNAAASIAFTPGAKLTGTLGTATDLDWFSFTGLAGQTFLAQLVPASGSFCDGFLRMFAGGGAASNRCAFSHFGGGVGAVVFTLPSDGTYYVRVLSWVGAGIGPYEVHTGLHTPVPSDVGQDHRDVLYSSSSDGGVDWTPPQRLSDAPARYDETFPEVAVDAGGRVYVMWYDHSVDAANGILTSMRVRESVDGGLHWQPSVRIDDGPNVNWNLVASNMFPNMGDYSQLVADGGNVHAIWADGRDGTPDPYYAQLVSASVGVPPLAVGALAVRGLGVGPGGSVRALISLEGSEPARVELFDVLGRRLAEQSIEGAPRREVTLGSDLPAGVYLVRATQGGAHAGARVAAMR